MSIRSFSVNLTGNENIYFVGSIGMNMNEICSLSDLVFFMTQSQNEFF